MNPKILIIDDESADRKAMAVILEREGYRDLLFAETAAQGLEFARAHKPDIIFIDVVLDHGIDGFDICIQLRQEGCSSKIIMETGHLEAIIAQKARTSGANEIIEKRAGFENLGETIKNIK